LDIIKILLKNKQLEIDAQNIVRISFGILAPSLVWYSLFWKKWFRKDTLPSWWLLVAATSMQSRNCSEQALP